MQTPTMEFGAACARGDLAAAQALAARAGLTAEVENIRAEVNSALRMACESGHVRVARWLAGQYDLTLGPRADVGVDVSGALRGACRNGHLEVAADEFVEDKFVSGWRTGSP